MEKKNDRIDVMPLRMYTREERKEARELVKIIVRNSRDSTRIHLNTVYVSTATKNSDNELLASEVPGKFSLNQ
jgi:hypothetical protein